MTTPVGALAVDDAGLRETFQMSGQSYYSYLTVVLRADGTQTDCNVTLRPAFVRFDTGTTSTRSFKTLVIDPGGGAILDDECGWEDGYILEQLRAVGPVEVGFAQARFEDDRPYLDVFVEGPGWVPSDTASVVYAGHGIGYAMAEDGAVDTNTMIEPVPGTLDRGAYQF